MPGGHPPGRFPGAAGGFASPLYEPNLVIYHPLDIVVADDGSPASPRIVEG